MRKRRQSRVSQGLSVQQRMYRITRLHGIFTRSQMNMLPEKSSPDLQTAVDLSCTPSSLSSSPTKSATDEMQKEQTPQVPPRIRIPQTQDNTKQLTQPDTQPALPARRLSRLPHEFSKWHIAVSGFNPF